MKQKKIETHKIGLIGQAPSGAATAQTTCRPERQKIARLAGMNYEELIACRRKHLNTHYSGNRRKGDAFDRAKGNVNAANVLMDWRVERIVLLGKNVARCFGFRDLPFLAEIHIYGRRFFIFRILLEPIGGGTNDKTNNALDNFCSGSCGAIQFRLNSQRVDVPLARGRRQVRPPRPRARSGY